ncbi:TonB family protein [Maritalea mobilis]|uniref:energy transducer TonB family protein n=1 Tax=Maritalea mobilis TaxID=483324 RepID=UPI001C95D638|nr:energy transducer TonB [Maritalea mobilis]MBY6201516.1 TonB family protein [Maritalea mobilis]
MRGGTEILAFLGLSAALHAGVAYWVPGDFGGAGQGAGGQDIVSLQASPAALSTLVREWRDAPEVSNVSALQPPQVTPDRPIAPNSDVAPVQHMPTSLSTPVLETAPQRPAAVPAPPARMQAMTEFDGPTLPTIPSLAPPPTADGDAPGRMVRPTLTAPDLTASPTVDATAPEPPDSPLAARSSPRPTARPERPEAAASPPRTPTPARVAGGSGGGATQGAATQPAPQPSLSAGERQSLIASWGAQIQRRIERSRPRVRGTGQVVLRLTITRGGQLAGVGIARPSGDPAIDRAAVQAVQRAGRFPAAPDGLTDPSYGFSLPVTFR